MLYELLCGQVPFQGDSEWEVLKKHESEPPSIPPHLTAREAAIVQRCLQKDPAARFASVQDLIAAFGAPTSAGAAAWTDTGKAAATVPPPPVPPPPASDAPPPPPPPLPGAEDPYAGLTRASKEAMRHAGTIAHKAAREAGRIAREAAAKVRESIEEHRRKRRRDRFGFGGRKAEPAADGMPPLPAAHAGAPVARRSRRQWPVFLAVMAFLVVFPALLFLMMAGTRVVRTGFTTYESAAATVAEPGVPSRHAGVVVSYRVPSRWNDLVSTSEPRWAAVVQQDRDLARELLLMHIERLREGVLQDLASGPEVAALPTFTARGCEDTTRTEIDQALAKIAERANLTAAEQRRIQALGPVPLAVAAERIAAIDWADPAAAKRGRRLHEWLVEVTACRDLELADPDIVGSEAAAVANQRVGPLWAWFVNEFGYNARTWDAYRDLLRVR
jgi:hypothetical protein